MKKRTAYAMEFTGAVSILIGVAVWSPPAAFVLGGIMLVVAALVVDLRREKTP